MSTKMVIVCDRCGTEARGKVDDWLRVNAWPPFVASEMDVCPGCEEKLKEALAVATWRRHELAHVTEGG